MSTLKKIIKPFFWGKKWCIVPQILEMDFSLRFSSLLCVSSGGRGEYKEEKATTTFRRLTT